MIHLTFYRLIFFYYTLDKYRKIYVGYKKGKLSFRRQVSCNLEKEKVRTFLDPFKIEFFIN